MKRPKSNGGKEDSNAYKPSGEQLECILEFTDKIRSIEFGPFNPTDHCLSINHASGKTVRLYFNSSLEMVNFFDTMLTTDISMAGHSKPRKAFTRMCLTTDTSGWQTIYVVIASHQSGDRSSIEKLVRHGIDKYFTYNKGEINSPDDVIKRWKAGVTWFKEMTAKFECNESEDFALFFRHTFQDMFFTYVSSKWNEYYDQMSYSGVCNLYNVYSCAVFKAMVADVPAWVANSERLMTAIGLSIEAAFINHTCCQVKQLVADILEVDFSVAAKDNMFKFPAAKEIGRLMESVSLKVSSDQQKFWKNLVERICLE